MIDSLTMILVMLLASISAFGWGSLALRISGYSKSQDSLEFSYSVVLGFAGLCVLGGVLNLLQIASGMSLGALFGIGIALSLLELYQDKPNLKSRLKQTLLDYSPVITSALLIGYAIWFLTTHLGSSTSFNLHDDLHTYLPRIPLALETGSLGNNPFGLIGLDSLGGQAFLQSFVVHFFGVDRVIAVDAVYFFGLSCFLVVFIAHKIKTTPLATLIALSSFMAVNTQQVNISSIYTTTALVFGFVIALMNHLKNKDGGTLSFLPALIFLSALISMKLLSAFLASFIFLAAFLPVLRADALPIRTFITKGAALTALTLPWILTHADKYYKALTLSGNANDGSVSISQNLANLPLETFLSSDELFWGGSLLIYNLLFAFALITCLHIVFSKENESAPSSFNAPVFAVALATVLCYLLGWAVFEFNMALRYALPFIAASTPLALLYFSPKRKSDKTRRYGLIATAHLIIILAFTTSMSSRLNTAIEHNSILRFPTGPQYNAAVGKSVSEQTKRKTQSIQNKVPQNEKILVWTSSPTNFDYKRNTIASLAEPVFATPWYKIERTIEPEELRTQLLEEGFGYVIWEFKGWGMKNMQNYVGYLENESPLYQKLGKNVLDMHQKLNKLAGTSKRLYVKDGVVVFSLRDLEPED